MEDFLAVKLILYKWIFYKQNMPKQDRLLVTVVNKFYGCVKSMILMYKTLFRPHLEYAVPICMVASSYTKDISSLEQAQKIRLSLLKSWDTDYHHQG